MTTAVLAGARLPRPVTGQPASVLEDLVLAAARPCTGSPDDWFPPEPPPWRRQARERYEARARALCRSCPVPLACLELTIAREGRMCGHGIAGATAPWQRQAIKASRGMTATSGADAAGGPGLAGA